MPANPPLVAAVPLSGRRPVCLGVFAAFAFGRSAVLAIFATCLLTAAAAAQTYEVLKVFNIDGFYPQARLVQATDGNLYGTTANGGASGSGAGTIFKIDTNGTTLTTLHSLAVGDGANPYAGLIQGSDGNLYGTTYYGGANGFGTIFKIDTNGSTLTTLHSFTRSDGANPIGGLIQASDGNLYGTTTYGGASNVGTIFKIGTSGTTFTTLHSFAGSDGSIPYAALIQGSDGNLYGTTTGGGSNGWGTVFKIDTSGSTLTMLHSFAGSDGAGPGAGVIQGTDANLYGTTGGGGANGNYGTVFKIDTSGSTFTTLHSFTYSDGAELTAGVIQGTDGNLYGTTDQGGANYYGTIFKIDTSGTTLTTLHSFNGADGEYALDDMLQASDGNLYGTTAYGGGGGGTIFKIDTSGSTFATLHNFARTDGGSPYADLVQATDGNLYGTTNSGGASNYGTIFQIDTNGSTFNTLRGFGNSGDGANPTAGVIQATDGNLYGTTSQGGASFGGTIFRIDTSGSTFTTLHSFAGSDGATPYGALIQATDGNLYGTTAGGGAGGSGTIFKIDTSGTTFTTLHSFAGSDGANPYARLIQGRDGSLYGTTYFGGASGNGTIFKIDTNGSTFTTLHSFGPAYSEGANPTAGLIQAADGNLYGTAYRAGTGGCTGGCGTIFKIDTNGTTFTTLHSFAGSDGANPYARLIQGRDGSLYGTTHQGGANNYGTVFKIDTNGTTLTTLHSYADADGTNPYAGLIQGTDDNLYGTTSARGPAGGGVVFKIVPCSLSQPPVITLSGPPTFCLGGSVTLDAGPGYPSYFWSPGGQTTQTIIVSTSGSYTVTVNDANGCLGTSAPVVVTVNPNPAPVVTVSHCPPPNTPGLGASVPANAGDTYNWTLAGGTIDSGQGTNAISFTSGGAGTPMSLSVVETTAANCVGTAGDTLQVDFNDVPSSDGFYSFVCAIGRGGITAGCGNGNYCRDGSVTRAQMAVFLLEGQHGAFYTPPPATGTVFADVPANAFAAAWIEQLSNEGITAGCGGGNYCPNDPVTRAQMAVFLLRAQHGSGYAPPACHGVFSDVPCPAGFAVDWIEQLSAEGVTGGCGGGNYCPDASSTRGQMAVFVVKTFNLP